MISDLGLTRRTRTEKIVDGVHCAELSTLVGEVAKLYRFTTLQHDGYNASPREILHGRISDRV